MHVISKPSLRLPSGPLLSRSNNFADLRELLATDNGRFSRQTLLLGDDYARVDFTPQLGHGAVEFIRVSENFFVIISELEFAADCAFKYLGENWIRFSFNMSGTAQMLFDGTRHTQVESRMSHLLLHPEGVVHSDHYFSGSQIRWVSIICRKEHLTEIVGFDPEAFPQELKRFLAHGESSLFLHKRPINVPMFRCVTEIFRKPSVVALRPLYLKGKAYEALYTFLDDFAADTQRPDRPPGLTRRDIDRLHEARALLEQDPGGEIGLAQLSRQLGMNRSKLSQGFHTLFGTTIFDFTRMKRMEIAYNLLQRSDLPVGQIAERCGYRHASSFSAAFKAQYGRHPRATRRK